MSFILFVFIALVVILGISALLTYLGLRENKHRAERITYIQKQSTPAPTSLTKSSRKQ